MADDLFATAWARLDRSAALREEMAEVWNGYLGKGPYDTDFVSQGDGVYVLRVLVSRLIGFPQMCSRKFPTLRRSGPRGPVRVRIAAL
jgi:hypothetical protein